MMIDIARAESINGWMTPKELTWLAERAHDHRIIAEVGSYHGRSARVLADHTLGKVYCIDPWLGTYFMADEVPLFEVSDVDYTRFLVNMKDHIDTGRMLMVRGTLADFAALNVQPDMIFIDGDHRYRHVKSDIQLAQTLLKQGGLLCGHDFGLPEWGGVEMAVRELFEYFNVFDTIWWVTV